jgi:hypothetical protein
MVVIGNISSYRQGNGTKVFGWNAMGGSVASYKKALIAWILFLYVKIKVSQGASRDSLKNKKINLFEL